MADGQLTEATFNENLNTKFSITLDEKVMELELVEIKPYREEPDSSMERFSIYFEGPAQPQLPQQTYQMDHERMGKFSLFQLQATRKLFDMRRFSTTSSRRYCGWLQLTHETPCVYKLRDLRSLEIRVVHKNDGRRCYAQRPCVAGACSFESPHR